jgi:hypothetical protein
MIKSVLFYITKKRDSLIDWLGAYTFGYLVATGNPVKGLLIMIGATVISDVSRAMVAKYYNEPV